MDPFKYFHIEHLNDDPEFRNRYEKALESIDLDRRPNTSEKTDLCLLADKSKRKALISCSDVVEYMKNSVERNIWKLIEFRDNMDLYRQQKEQRRMMVRENFRLVVEKQIIINTRNTQTNISTTSTDPYTTDLYMVAHKAHLNNITHQMRDENNKRPYLNRLFQLVTRMAMEKSRKFTVNSDPWQTQFGRNANKQQLKEEMKAWTYTTGAKFQKMASMVKVVNDAATNDPWQHFLRSSKEDEINSEMSFQPEVTIQQKTILTSKGPSKSKKPKASFLPPISKPRSPRSRISKTKEKRIRIELNNNRAVKETIEIIHTTTKRVSEDELDEIIERLCRPLDRRVHSKAVRDQIRREKSHFPKIKRVRNRDLNVIIDRLCQPHRQEMEANSAYVDPVLNITRF